MAKKSSRMRRLLSGMLSTVMLATLVPSTAFAVGAANTGSFLTGPYLMTPKTNGMVVVWELDKPMKSTITYGTSDADKKTLEVPVEEGEKFKGESMHMYRARLTDLTPGTTYTYKVETEDGQTMEGHFRTLPENSDEIRFVVVSDSHRFETATKVSDVIAQFDPDFILHTGDMVEGTGSQKDQFPYWFQNVGSFLHNVPVIYNSGNHDYGVYFDEYVTKVQKEQYKSNETGRNVAFDCGPVHFDMLDSNPWSLFELNSTAGGGEADAATKAVVNESLDWLKADLATDNAKKADFRVVTMHHPFEDDLTRKYVPSIVENGNVNIMFSGHTHLYSRYASADPKRGADTLYVTQGDARIGGGKIDTGKPDQRLNDNYPNLLATGKGDMLEVTVKDGLLTYKNLGLSNDSEKVFETVTLSKDGAKLAYSDISITPDTVQSNGTVTVSAKVTNVGKGLATASMCVKDNGTDRWLYEFGKSGKERVVGLNPGESVTLSAPLTLSALGTHTLKLDSYTKTVNVTFRKATYTYSNLRLQLGSGTVSEPTSDVIYAKADVQNIGNEDGTAEAVLYINGAAVTSQKTALKAGETRTVEFAYKAPAGGSYTVKVGNSAEKTVAVLGSIQGTPIVKDKSGKGNDGIIRGNPTLVKYNGGWGLSLDGVDDYVEIPDNKNYVVDNGVTGMVWANIDRLATGDEWDHNPLLMKGASISYGTNYLFRMAVRKTGMVTYGIGFNNDNGEYFWNDDENMGGGVTLGKWVQYTGGFDRATGGDSYEDTKASGHTDAPNFDSEIRNWEGKSMYSGFAFHRHLLTGRGRGKTHTMLTGDIGQLRFYTTKLTAEENKQIYANPTAKGPESDKLVVWLDYAPENIVTKGTHTTEWRAMTGSAAQFTYNAEITGAASATATVETSDDGKTVKASQSAELKNGKNTVDISALGSAKYVRVTTVLNSSVAEKSTDIPVINSYSIKAGNTNTWATLADWNEGTFTDAVGYESDDVFNDYSVDYDDYGTVGKNVKVVEGTVSTFTDIAGHWAKDAIEYVTDKALFNGTTATTFSPNEGMTRGMFVTVLGRMAGADISAYNTQSQFADVDSKMYYNAYVNWAAANKIVSGVDASHFNPNALITREQAAVIMDNYLTATGTKVEETGSAAAFADSASIRAYAKDAVTRMQKAGLLSGKSGNRFDPQGTATRAQVAVIMQKLCEKTGK